jgi:hypothetical protein
MVFSPVVAGSEGLVRLSEAVSGPRCAAASSPVTCSPSESLILLVVEPGGGLEASLGDSNTSIGRLVLFV